MAEHTPRTAIGPRAVLPPGEYAEGAGVVFGLITPRKGRVTHWPMNAEGDGPSTAIWIASFGSEVEGGAYHDPCSIREWNVRLDLRTGCLSHGCRALLHLVAPEVEQPLCAPSWEAENPSSARGDRMAGETLWVLTAYGRSYAWGFKEKDPRLALVAALENASER